MVTITKDMSWREISAAVRKHCLETIAKVEPAVPGIPEDLPFNVTTIPSKLLSKDVLEITESPTELLLSKLASGAITSTAVTKAFLQRAGLATKLVNCATELLPDRALERASYLDAYYAEHKSPVGPLHGLPISVKEHIAMKGLSLNAGFVSWAGNEATDDGLILKLLWRAGCVFYVRTTEPQTLMHLETSSNLFGTTLNPFNTRLTSGGSSGGEGAQMGLRGSCLGIGTDIGGSIRSPAANQGLFGLRPTSYRLPLDGFSATMQGQEHIVPVVGPLSTSLAGIKVFMQVLLDQKPWLYDPALAPFPWNPKPALRQSPDGKPKLRIGVLRDDGVVRPHPPILRGIDTLVAALKSDPSIEIVEFPPYDHETAWRIISSLYFADGGKQESAAIEASGEPWRPLSEFIIKQNPNVRALSVPEVWELTCQRDAYKAEYTKHWNSVGFTEAEAEGLDAAERAEAMVDVILCPVGPGCAPIHGCAKYWGYTAQWNLLDYPSLIFPTGLQAGAQDKVGEGYQPRNEKDEFNHKIYDPEMYQDAPISLQLVGRRYEDEKVIAALEHMTKIANLPFTSA